MQVGCAASSLALSKHVVNKDRWPALSPFRRRRRRTKRQSRLAGDGRCLW